MITIKQIRNGSIVVVRGGFGTEPPRQVRVTEVLANIKNGRPGIDYVEPAAIGNSSGRWAYLDQVLSVVTY